MSDREERMLRSLAALRDGALPGTRAMFVLAVAPETIAHAARDLVQGGAQVVRDGDVLMVCHEADSPSV